jgi:pimeloyl-ACP methyl ester carboxylesterase
VLRQPDRIYITGHSMGGHIAAAAVEAETLDAAVNQIRYDGAVPMCGVMGDTELFNTFAAMQLAAQTMADVPDHPFTQWDTVAADVTGLLFTRFPSEPTPLGQEYLSVVENLTGGPRPLFAQGVAFGGSFPSAYGTFGDDGTINGILSESVLDTRNIAYPYTDNQGNAQTLNVTQVFTPEEGANRLRSDGLRWIPQLAGNISVPVVSIHTLGDLFVPFDMQQVYRQRVVAQGSDKWLVERAIRGASHCDFTVAEQERAFSDMVGWVNGGPQPTGDDVLAPEVVAHPAYGCTFTNNTLGVDDSPAVANLRTALIPTRAACLMTPGG